MATVETRPSCCLPGDVAEVQQKSTAKDVARTGSVGSAMIALAGGWFRMGADDGPHLEDGEGPARDVYIDACEIAATAVTIDEFAEFVKATGYRTQAESLGTSFVFYAHCDPAESYRAPVQSPWWRQVPGACWHSPYGPSQNEAMSGDHPVTHITRGDALAYCQWSGSRLPTEAEWEYAARGHLLGQPFPWGENLEEGGLHRANVWQGTFPDYNSGTDGYQSTAPVDAYGPQGFGHFNMIGNVWEWVSDRFTNLHSPRAARNPKGPLNGSDFVAKGGSYLCHASYCERYRTSSRQMLPAPTTTGNLGFRVARNLPTTDT